MSAEENSGAMNDLSRLYLEFAPSLQHLVRCGVRASDDVVEDACQVAWMRLVHHRDRIDDQAARGWLTRTAVHEAFKLCRRKIREPPCDLDAEDGQADPAHPVAPGPHHLLEQRQRLGSVSRLPLRQQRLVWLRALGLGYEEIAAYEGCTERTVERQLERARRRLRCLEVGGGQIRRAA